jgi:hypothetical protein
MLNGREEHNTLLLIAVICCILGAGSITIGIFIFYMLEHHCTAACLFESGGSLLFFIGMSVGKYTKRNSRR